MRADIFRSGIGNFGDLGLSNRPSLAETLSVSARLTGARIQRRSPDVELLDRRGDLPGK